MRNFPVTPRYEFPVNATYNMLDIVYEEATSWTYYGYSGEFRGGDYTNLDSVVRIFEHYDDGTEDGAYRDVTDEKIVKGWICRRKLANAIDKAREDRKDACFEVEVEATAKFLPRSSSSVTQGEESFWQSIGEIAMTAPMSQVTIDDDELIELAVGAGADELAAAYADYVRAC